MNTKFQMIEYVTNFEMSEGLHNLHLDHSYAWKWIKIGDQEPIVVFRKWADEHRALMRDKMQEYNAYMVHELIEILGDEYKMLERSIEYGYIAYAMNGTMGRGDRPQDALADLLLHIKGNNNDQQDRFEGIL